MNDFRNFKRTILFLVLGLMQTKSIHAFCDVNPFCINPHKEDVFFCDLCSCSTGSGSLGFGTLSNANFMGVRYIYQNFESKDGIFSDSPITKETFNTYQLWAQIPINKSIFVSATLPYQNLNRSYADNTNENIHGIGDANIMGWYRYIFYKKQDENLVATDKEASGHSLKFGVGIKLPTGKFEESLADNVNPGFQVGTGSIDNVFSLGYSYGKYTYGVNALLSYYIKGENKNEYQFGNQFSYNINFYRAFSTKKANIMPFVAISGDVYNKIIQYDETLQDTDGSVVNTSIGAEVAVSKFIFGASYSKPISQNLFGDNVQSKQQLSVYINYAL